MMNEYNEPKRDNPIRQLTDHLADLILRLVETERQLTEARQSSDEWYQNWQRKDAQLKETQENLAEEIEEHQNTQRQLREALEKLEKGGHDNG
jgi:gas vesicle protein